MQARRANVRRSVPAARSSSPGPRQAGRGLDQAVEEPVDQAAGRFEVVVEVDRPDQRLHGVGEDRGLVPAAGGLLALAEAQEVAEAERAGNVRERAGS